MQSTFKKIICAVVVATMLSTSGTHAAWSDWLPSWLTPHRALLATAGLGAIMYIAYQCCASSETSANKKKTKKKSTSDSHAKFAGSGARAYTLGNGIQKESFTGAGAHGGRRALDYVPEEAEKNAQLFAQAIECINNNNDQQFKDLTQENPHIWEIRSEGRTLLMLLVQKFNSGIMPNMQQNNSEFFNARDNNGATPLMYAIKSVGAGDQSDKVDFIKKLIEKRNADVLVQDNHGNTILHYAAQTGCVLLVRMIVEKMFAQNSATNHLEVKNQKMMLSHESDAIYSFRAEGVDAAMIARVRARQMQKSTYRKNYYEVAAYLQNIHWHDGQIRNICNLPLEQLTQELMENGSGQ